jgi:hypothetical protein
LIITYQIINCLMKSLFSKVTQFFKREWFLLFMLAAISVIIFLFEVL